MKGRSLFFSLVAILVVAIAVYALFRTTRTDTTTTKLEHLTPEMQRLVPKEWETIESTKCDFDGDSAEEGLLLYRYDLAEAKTSEEAKKVMKRGLIGAAIYDAQVAPLSEQPVTSQPYRPTEIVTYRLLPDFYADKGQGYIGESKATWHLFPNTIVDGKCQATELAFLGYSGIYNEDDLPTRLSIFRWEPAKKTYLAAHFVGNARIDVVVKDSAKPVTQVVTYNRLNDRSLLCEARTYERPAGATHVNFTENTSAFSLDFCFDAPGDPTYPEGTIMAYLRGKKPAAENEAKLPPNDSFLLPGVNTPSDLSRPIGVLAISRAAAITPGDDGGFRCGEQFSGWTESDLIWWCGRETATVLTEVGDAASPRTLTWTLISVAPETVNADIHWRIKKVE